MGGESEITCGECIGYKQKRSRTDPWGTAALKGRAEEKPEEQEEGIRDAGGVACDGDQGTET